MGLPRDVAIHNIHAGFTAPSPMCCTFTPYPYHTIGCEMGRSQQALGGLASPQRVGECSSISITPLLHIKNTYARPSGSSHTPPIKVMGNPSNVWGKSVTAERLRSQRMPIVIRSHLIHHQEAGRPLYESACPGRIPRGRIGASGSPRVG